MAAAVKHKSFVFHIKPFASVVMRDFFKKQAPLIVKALKKQMRKAIRKNAMTKAKVVRKKAVKYKDGGAYFNDRIPLVKIQKGKPKDGQYKFNEKTGVYTFNNRQAKKGITLTVYRAKKTIGPMNPVSFKFRKA